MELFFAAITFVMFVIRDIYVLKKRGKNTFENGYQKCIDDLVSEWNGKDPYQRQDYVIDFMEEKSNGRYKRKNCK